MNTQVKVILKPPYLVKNGQPKMPSYCTANIFVGNNCIKKLSLSTTASAKKVLQTELFQLRALSRQKELPCRVELFLEEGRIGLEYRKVREKNERKEIDVTYMFPHKFD